MRIAILSATILVALIGNSAAEEGAKPGPSPKCLKAEINPVTGHVLCIDPIGAPVEAPLDQAKLPCKPEQERGQWTYGPGCTPDPEGM
jgi:hypothetical protein